MIKKRPEKLQVKRKKIKIKTENTAIGATLEKEKNVTEFLQRAQKIKYKGYN